MPNYVWFEAPKLSQFYGALAIAFGTCAAICPMIWLVAHQHMKGDLPKNDAFLEQWVHDTADRSVDDFVGSYWTTEDSATGKDEVEREFVDSEPLWDGRDHKRLDCFEVLGISPGTSVEEIKRAYWNKVKQYHPDRVATLGLKLRELAERETKSLNVAYEEALRS